MRHIHEGELWHQAEMADVRLLRDAYSVGRGADRGGRTDPGQAEHDGRSRPVHALFDRHEHALEQEKPHRSFRLVTAESLRLTMADLGLRHEPGDAEILTSSISKMPPFPEV